LNLEKYETVEFAWGEMDCCLFVADVIRDMTGHDYAASWRGRYGSETGALRMIAEYGSLVALASSVFGEIKPFWAVRAGDPVLLSRGVVEQDRINQALGIFDGDQIAYLTDCGLDRAPVTAAVGCWHV